MNEATTAAVKKKIDDVSASLKEAMKSLVGKSTMVGIIFRPDMLEALPKGKVDLGPGSVPVFVLPGQKEDYRVFHNQAELHKYLEDRTLQNRIDATHPTEDGAPEKALAADAMAMQLVHDRHSKRDLVNLVRWLIVERPELV